MHHASLTRIPVLPPIMTIINEIVARLRFSPDPVPGMAGHGINPALQGYPSFILLAEGRGKGEALRFGDVPFKEVQMALARTAGKAPPDE